MLKHITAMLKTAPIPMPVANLQLDICRELKKKSGQNNSE
jgi:hypothetical protein